MSERPKARPLVTNDQAHRALEDLMPVIEWLTDTDAILHDLREGRIDEDTMEGRYLAAVMEAFRAIPEDSPAIDAYMRWLVRNTRNATDGGRTDGTE